ncbi:uncharacterized protein LOC126838715 [Adelges cooleyi]|uniref:uncharacterized protein LOC126838715 n=1 Tax=Adelges cooleyi TaxID=133065 RepID=UPI00217F8A54|nr:uncharacterized protein LOC126838715 [Adelges cooleyi]XP_050429324.1 uncharacterized protein LOC126838715 [Adelges cooleyi]XP_050429325.1 uncharacterized protein LOC126838715 [Adelges cooleyi]
MPLGDTENLSITEKDNLVQGKENQVALRKLNRKIQKLKCVYGKIVQTAIAEIKSASISYNLTSLIKKYRPYVSKMMSTLMTANIVAANWLWDLLILLVAAEKVNLKVLAGFESKLLSISVQCNSFVEKCYNLTYLSHSNSSVSKDPSQAYNGVMKILNDDIKTGAYKNLNQYADEFVSTSNIMLNQLKVDSNPISIKHIIKEDLWRKIAVQLEKMWETPADTLIGKQKEISQHHDTIIATVNVSVAYAVWIHLKTVVRNKTNSATCKQSVIRHYRNLLEVLRKAVAQLSLQENTFYQNLLERLSEENIVLPKLDSLVNDAKDNFSTSLKAIIIVQSNAQTVINKLEMDSTLVTEFTNIIEIPEKALQNIDQLRNFIVDVAAKLTSFHWSLMKYYKQCLSDNWIGQF